MTDIEQRSTREIIAAVALHAALNALLSRTTVAFGDAEIEALVRNSFKIGIEFAKQAESHNGR